MAISLPQKFLDSLCNVKGFDEKAFKEVHESSEKVASIRVNPAKSVIEKISGSLLKTTYLTEEKLLQNDGSYLSFVPWCLHGFYLKERPSFTFDPLLHAGAYYVQEASSMFLWEVLKQATKNISVNPKVLDVCAAPGGKTTLLSTFFKDGLIVANEVIKSRVNTLIENITKWGCANVIVTNNDTKSFTNLESYFDVIVTDAPCSGSGLFRKNRNAVNEWSEKNVTLCSKRQHRILADIISVLKKNGILIYSTCSYSAEENEEVIDWLKSNYNLSSIPLQLKDEWGIIEVQSNKHKAYGYRFFPDKVKGEGFFISAFIKNEGDDFCNHPSQVLNKISNSEIPLIRSFIKNNIELFYFYHKENILAISSHFKKDIEYLKKHLFIRKAGILIGAFKGKDFFPSHELSLSSLINATIETLILDKLQAIQYLKKQEMQLHVANKGWALANYAGCNLGWMKILPNRINNYYPAAWRILKEIE